MVGKAFWHFLKVRAGLELPQTQTTAAERALLEKYAQGESTIVEIDVFEGFTTRVLAQPADPTAVVDGVAPFLPAGLEYP